MEVPTITAKARARSMKSLFLLLLKSGRQPLSIGEK
jgi:hypothetical protein